MERTARCELPRSEESLAQALEVRPATNSQRHISVLGGPLGIEAVHVNEVEVTRGGAYQ
jgi:hypothetical protein